MTGAREADRSGARHRLAACLAQVPTAPEIDPDFQRQLAEILHDEVPELAGRLAEIDRDVHRNGYHLGPACGIESMPPSVQVRLAVAMAAAIASPARIGGSNLVAWDVTPGPDLAGHQPGNVSTTDGEAVLHTDSAFSDRPEDLFGLWCLRPAERGGASVQVDARDLVHRLLRTPQGAAAVTLLRAHDVPVDTGEPEVRWVRTITDDVVRLRPDLTMRGFARTAHGRDDELVQAFNHFSRALREAAGAPIFVPAGHVLVVDNHRLVHGRTTFSDPRRHLLRIRMTGRPVLEWQS